MKINKKTITKLIAIVAGFIFVFVAIFFSGSSGNADFAGKGNGENLSVATPEEISEVLSGLPKANYYFGLSETAEAAELTEFKSVTIDLFSSNFSESLNTNSSSTNNMRAYFTENAAFYNIELNIHSSNKISSDKYELIKKDTYVAIIDMDAYVGKQGILVKYNFFNVTEENYNIEGIEEDKDGELKRLCFNQIRSNLGKWINLKYSSDASENAKSDEWQTQFTNNCKKVSNILIQQLNDAINVDFSNMQKYVNAAMKDANKKDFYNYERKSSDNKYAANCTLDMSSPQSPKIVSVTRNYTNISEIDEVSNIDFYNIDNTVIKKVPTAVSFENFFGKAIEKAMRNTSNSLSAENGKESH